MRAYLLFVLCSATLLSCHDSNINNNSECVSHEECRDDDECTLDVCGYDGCLHEDICHEGWDLDGDGYEYPDDCDDRRIDVNPNADEVCDFRDNDCDGEVDEGACEYRCDDELAWCRDWPEENEVSIDMDRSYYRFDSWTLGSCIPDAPNTMRLESGDLYSILVASWNLVPGDVIERFVITQDSGIIPLPSGGTENVVASLDIHGDFGDPLSPDTAYGAIHVPHVHQDDDGTFTFTDITIPSDFYPGLIEFWFAVPYAYSGYLQLGILDTDAFVVTDKTTITQRCSFPQHAWFTMVVCPDRDDDGHDDNRCGGDDYDDHNPLRH